MPVDPSFDFNRHQRNAVQAYGTGQEAVDYILAQRYGAESFGAMPPDQPETFGRVVKAKCCPGWRECEADLPDEMSGDLETPSMLELRYRGL